MYPFIETIKVKNGVLQNLQFHQERMNRSRSDFLGLENSINLKSMIEVPDIASTGVFMCRVIYGTEVGKIEFIRYKAKIVETLKLVIDNGIDYRFKFSDRTRLEKLRSRKGDCNEILIVKNGFITDTSYSNIVFFNGKSWLTPDQPLLKGTMRAALLEKGKIKTAQIKTDDLYKFTKFKLINAMMDFDEGNGTLIENILD